MRPAAPLLILLSSGCLERHNVELPPLDGEVALAFSMTDGRLAWTQTLASDNPGLFALGLGEDDLVFIVTPTVPTTPITAQMDRARLSEARGFAEAVSAACQDGEVMEDGWIRLPIDIDDPITVVAGEGLPDDIRERISFAVPPSLPIFERPFTPYGQQGRIVPADVTFDGGRVDEPEEGGIFNMRFLARLGPDRAAIGSRFALHLIGRGQASIRAEDAIYRYPEDEDLEGLAYHASTDTLHAAWKACDDSRTCLYSRVESFTPTDRLVTIDSTTVAESIRDLSMDDRGRRIYPTDDEVLLLHDGQGWRPSVRLDAVDITQSVFTRNATHPFSVASVSGLVLGDPFADTLRTVGDGGATPRSIGGVSVGGAFQLWIGRVLYLSFLDDSGASTDIRLHLPAGLADCSQRDPRVGEPNAQSCGETVPATTIEQIVQWSPEQGGDGRVYFLLDSCRVVFAISPQTYAVTAYETSFADGEPFLPRVLLPTPEGILIGAQEGMMAVFSSSR